MFLKSLTVLICLTLFSEASGQKAPCEFMDPRFGAIPTYSKDLREARVVTDSQGRVLKEEHSREGFNPCIGEAIACISQVNEFNQVRAQYIRDRVIEGESMEKAREEAEEVGEVYKKVEGKAVKVEAARQKLEKAVEKHGKALQTQPIEAKEKDAQNLQNLQNMIASDETQEVQQALFEYRQEVENAKSQISEDLANPTLSENAKQYLRQVGHEFCRFADCMIGTLNQLGYAAGELLIPGGMAAYEAGMQGANFDQAIEAQKQVAGEEFAITQSLTAGGCVAGGALGYAGYKLGKFYKALKSMPVLEKSFLTKMYSKHFVEREVGKLHEVHSVVKLISPKAPNILFE